MTSAHRVLALAAVLSLTQAGGTFADVTLPEAVEIAVQGRWADEPTQSITLNGHGFYLRPVAVSRTADGATAEGFFRHRHRGMDDRVYYVIIARKGQPYKAVITKIEYRGVLGNSVVGLGVEATGAASNGATGAAVAAAILEALKKLKIQTIFDGKWEPQAAKVVDALGARLARDLN